MTEQTERSIWLFGFIFTDKYDETTKMNYPLQ